MAAQTISLLSINPLSSPQFNPRNRNSHYSTTHFFPESIPLAGLLSLSSKKKHNYLERRSRVIIVAQALPTTKKIDASTEYSPKWSARAIKSFVMAELAARKLRYTETGTESLLLGILDEGTSLAAKFLRSHGITIFKVRLEIVNLVGKASVNHNSDVNPPLTEPAQKALDLAVDLKLKSGESGEVTTTHLLLAIWAQEVSVGRKVLENFGFNDDKAKELAKFIDKEVLLSIKQ